MLYLVREDVIEETLDAHKAKFFDTYSVTGRPSKKNLTSSAFMETMATFVQRQTDNALEDKGTVVAKASKKEPLAATEAYGNITAEPPRQSDWGSEEPQLRRSSRRRSKNCHAKCEDSHVKQHSHSTESLKKKLRLQDRVGIG